MLITYSSECRQALSVSGYANDVQMADDCFRRACASWAVQRRASALFFFSIKHKAHFSPRPTHQSVWNISSNKNIKTFKNSHLKTDVHEKITNTLLFFISDLFLIFIVYSPTHIFTLLLTIFFTVVFFHRKT